MRTVAGLVLVAMSVTACAPPDAQADETHARARAEAIIGGTPTGDADPEVFALINASGPFCSATLIHPRVLLTAAHCLAVSFSQATNDPQGRPDRAVNVISTWSHPAYATHGVGEFDLGLVLLRAPVTSVTPKPFLRTIAPPLVAGRALGYGMRSSNMNAPRGERYTVTLPITKMIAGELRYGSATKAICFGDSGGPFFANIGGVETLVAVHSYSDVTCSYGGGALVDQHAVTLGDWIAANVCPFDGRCDDTCPTPDPDCVCGADGQCTAACPLPDFDVDCPPHCGDDDVCGGPGCPAPDLDCRLLGARCDRADQCLGGRCTSDPQHPDAYCSSGCVADADCVDGEYECFESTCRFRQIPEVKEGEPCQLGDRCVAGTACHLIEGGRSFCAKPCESQNDCIWAEARCRFGLSSWKACAKPTPAVTLGSLRSVELPAASGGCSSTGAELFACLVALLARRRARSQN